MQLFSPQNNSGTVIRPDIADTFREFDLEMNEMGMVGSRLYPIKEVPQVNFEYKVVPKEELLQEPPKVERASGGNYNEVGYEIEIATGKTHDYGLQGFVDDRESSIYDADDATFDSDAEMAQIVRNLVMTAYEARIQALVQNGTNTAAASAEWTTTTTDIVGDVRANRETFRDRCGFYPNVMRVGAKVFEAMLDNDDIVTRIQYSVSRESNMGVQQFKSMARSNPSMLANLFLLDDIVVTEASKNTADKGQALTRADIWTETQAELLKVSEGSTLATRRGIGAGKTFCYTRDGAAPMGTVEQWRLPGARGRWVRVRHDCDEVTLDGDFIQEITGVTS